MQYVKAMTMLLIFGFTIFLISFQQIGALKVFSTTDDIEKFVVGGRATLTTPPNASIEDITICYRFLQFSNLNNQFHIIDGRFLNVVETALIYFGTWKQSKSLEFMGQSFTIIAEWRPLVWNTMCMSYETKSSNIIITSNNLIMRFDVEKELKKKLIPEKLLKNLTLMGGTGVYANSSAMFGKMTDVNIWSYAMTVEELKAWMNCKKNLSGNVIDWETAEWEIKEIKWEVINKSEVCKVSEPGLTMFPMKR